MWKRRRFKQLSVAQFMTRANLIRQSLELRERHQLRSRRAHGPSPELYRPRPQPQIGVRLQARAAYGGVMLLFENPINCQRGVAK
jgi:hypothetical protein